MVTVQKAGDDDDEGTTTVVAVQWDDPIVKDYEDIGDLTPAERQQIYKCDHTTLY
jgi:hypothetical protein